MSDALSVAQTVKHTTSRGENRYDVRLRRSDGTVRTKTFTRRKDADNFAVTLGAEKHATTAAKTYRLLASVMRAAMAHRVPTQ